MLPQLLRDMVFCRSASHSPSRAAHVHSRFQFRLGLLATAWTCCLAVPGLAPAALRGQADDFPTPTNNERDKTAEVMPAATAAAQWDLPENMQATVFASEPAVQNPIDLAWDSRGRLWVAENYTYSDRSERFDLSLRDRVLIFTDEDGDGVHDRRQVFTDDVQMMTSVEVAPDGVWLICPPRLLFVPDRDHDDRPDGPAEVKLDGFTVAEENYHNFANGLRFGPDGWLYGRCGGSCPGRVGRPGTPPAERIALEGGIWRYHPQTERVEVLSAGTTNPWGHDWNATGELFFINTVNGHLWHLIPGAHFRRPFTLDPNPHVYHTIDFHADHWHFDTGQSWTASRDGAANAYGGGHAHIGAMIYQGDNWPSIYRDRLFTWNMHGRRANQEILTREGSGYVAKHAPDIALAADPWFRGMELSTGPDGAVYVLDWSDTGECHEHTGVHRTSGRIYKITYKSTADRSATSTPSSRSTRFAADDLRDLTDMQLVELQGDSNVWFVRQARQLLATRAREGKLQDNNAIERLRRQALQPKEQLALRSLWTLAACEAADEELLMELLEAEPESVRVWAIRLITNQWPLDDVFGPTADSEQFARQHSDQVEKWLPYLHRLAENDPSGLVQLTLASTLQRLPRHTRVPLAQRIVMHAEYADDHNLPLMVWYGVMPVADTDPLQLAKLVPYTTWPLTRQFVVRRLGEELLRHPQAINEVLRRAEHAPQVVQQDVLEGLAQGLQGWRTATAPESWPSFAKQVKATGTDSMKQQVRALEVLFGDGRALEQVRALILDEAAEINARRSALRALVESRPEDIETICLPLLKDPRLNVEAAAGMAQVDGLAAGRALVENYRRFRAPQRPKVIAILVSRAAFAEALLEALENDRLPREAVSAFDVRQLHTLGDEELSARISRVWGEVRETPAELAQQIADWRATFSQPDAFAQADLSRGRRLFNAQCARCHRLFGEGEQIGPELTGANRDNLDYLLENVIAPSAVVSTNYRMSTLVLDDGRVLNGLVVSETDRTLTLQTQNEKVVLEQASIEDRVMTDQSPMPAGLLAPLSPEEIRDLFGYLRSPGQVPLERDE